MIKIWISTVTNMLDRLTRLCTRSAKTSWLQPTCNKNLFIGQPVKPNYEWLFMTNYKPRGNRPELIALTTRSRRGCTKNWDAMLCAEKSRIIFIFSRGQKLRELNCKKIPKRSPYIRRYVVTFQTSTIATSQSKSRNSRTVQETTNPRRMI